jgi:orotate phosphoribosyltransferase
VEGGVEAGARLVLVDDLATRGASAQEALPVLRGAGYLIEELLVLIDRQSGARDRLASHGVSLRAVFAFGDLLDFWRREGLITQEQHQRCAAFMRASQGGQA